MRINRKALLSCSFCVVWPVGVFAQSAPAPYAYSTRYDSAGRVTGTIAPDPDGTGPLRFPAVRNTYDAAGRLETVETGQLAEWQGENVKPSQWPGFAVTGRVDTAYDGLDRKVAERASGTSGVYSLTQFSYNNVGLLECTAVRMNKSDFGSPPSNVCQHSETSKLESNRPTRNEDRITRNEYDEAGQLLRIIKAYGTSIVQTYATYEYTPTGKRKAVIDANGNRAEMEYDGHDRQSLWIFPFSAASQKGQANRPLKDGNGNYTGGDYEQYGYDANGNRTSLRKRSGQTITFTYDALNHVTGKLIPAGAGARSVYYDYDLRGLQTSACFDALNGNDCVRNEYDGFGRIASTATVMGSSFSRKIGFGYDANGNRTRITHPDNTAFQYTFDGLDRLNGISQAGNALLAATYNARGSLEELDHKGSKTVYVLDANGRLQNQQLTVPSLSTTLQYNAAGQINGRTLSNLGYAFNAHANFDRSYSVNGLNQYSMSGANAVDYDANGNLVAVRPPGRDPEIYTYDIENRLLSKSTGVPSASNPPSTKLTYDPLGRLWSVAENDGTEVRFLYDGDQLSAEYDAGGNLLRRYLHGFGDDDPLVWYEGSGLGERRILQANHQGSVVAVVSASGSLLRANGYDEYGINNPDNMGRFQYTGQAWFNRLGLYHYKARFYSPTLGRFLQTDPIGYDDQINLYAYVANDPVNGRDPTGMQDTSVERAIERDNRALLTGQIKEEEYRDRANARGMGAIAGAGVLATVWTAGRVAPPLLSLAARALGFGGRVAEIGTNFGKLGTVVEARGASIAGYTAHGAERAAARGVSEKLAERIVANPSAVLSQSGGKHLYATNNGVVVLSKEGNVVTAYSRKFFDETIKSVLGIK